MDSSLTLGKRLVALGRDEGQIMWSRGLMKLAWGKNASMALWLEFMKRHMYG